MDEIQFLLEPVSSVEGVGPLWQRLEDGGDGSFFVSWTWIGTWLRCLPEHIRPLLLMARRDGEAIGAAILVSRRERRRGVLSVRQLHFNSTGDPALDCIWIEHNGFAGSAEAQHDLWPAFLRWFAQQGAADELLVPRVAEDAIGEIPEDTGLLHRATSSPGYVYSRPPDTLDAVLARLSRNTRQQLRRSLRASEKLGELRIETAPSAPVALAWFEELKVLHVAHWSARGLRQTFHYPFAEKFLRCLIDTGVPEQRVRLQRICAGPIVLGYLCDFRHNGCVYAYQSGFDDAHAELRPGYVSHALAIAQAGGEGAVCCDFLGGENRLKSSLGSGPYTLSTHRFGRPALGLRLEAALIGAARFGGGNPAGSGKP